VLFETDGEKTIKKLQAITSSMQCVKLFKRLLPQLIRQVIKKQAWFGIPKVQVKVSRCVAMQVSYFNNLPCRTTLLIVTDRNDLDGQLFETFSQAQELLKQTPVQANNRDELRQLLAERESGGIIFTTVQKFALLDGEAEHPLLNGRHNIVVMSDEAHRSQYGLKAKLSNDGTYKFGYAKHMRDALKNAAFIGFTGTPISSEDKDTELSLAIMFQFTIFKMR
jgi:type I restriction enzyme R subunit